MRKLGNVIKDVTAAIKSPEPKAPDFKPDKLEEERQVHFERARASLKSAIEATLSVPQGATIAQYVADGLRSAIEAELLARKATEMFRESNSIVAYAKKFEEEQAAEKESNKKVVKELIEEVEESERKLEAKK